MAKKKRGAKKSAGKVSPKTAKKRAKAALKKAEKQLKVAETYAKSVSSVDKARLAIQSKAAVAALNAGAARVLAARAPSIDEQLKAYSRDITAIEKYKKVKRRASGGKKRKSAPRATKRAAAPSRPPARKPAKKSRRKSGSSNTVITAAQVLKMAKTGKLKRWLCEAPKRTGCGKRARVVSGKGSFARLRAPRGSLAA